MDTQQVEIIGRNLLISACVADGLEVANPLRDKGIDLIVYVENTDGTEIRSLPIQLKASSVRSFSVHAKYTKFPNLLMAYTWNSINPQLAELYIMSYTDALSIAEQMGWLSTKSWTEGGGYSSQKPSEKLISLLNPFKYKEGSIKSLFTVNRTN
jgi:hypothetical protein